MDDFASGVDNLVIKSLMSSFTLLRLFFTRFKHFELLSTFLLLVSIIQMVVQAKYCSANVLFSQENDEFNTLFACVMF